MNLDDGELALLARAKAADGRIAADALTAEEQKVANRLAYLGMLDRQRHNGKTARYVLTPAGAQALNHH